MKLVFIDHYDSFSANLQAWLLSSPLPIELEVVAFDNAHAMQAVGASQDPLVLSPGPNSPHDAAATLALVQKKLGKVPIFGVCLGHQILGLCAGGSIVRCKQARHGEVHRVCYADRTGQFAGMAAWGRMPSYNSLVVGEENRFKADWYVTARSAAGEIWGLEYRPVHGAWAFGVQFHPESFLAEGSELLRDNWLHYACKVTAPRPL